MKKFSRMLSNLLNVQKFYSASDSCYFYYYHAKFYTETLQLVITCTQCACTKILHHVTTSTQGTPNSSSCHHMHAGYMHQNPSSCHHMQAGFTKSLQHVTTHTGFTKTSSICMYHHMHASYTKNPSTGNDIHAGHIKNPTWVHAYRDLSLLTVTCNVHVGPRENYYPLNTE